MKPLFQLDLAANGFVAVAAAAVVLVVLGSGLRENTNRWFLVFAVVEAFWAVLTILLRSSLLTGIGSPLLLAQLTGFAYGLVAPLLFLFAAHYTGAKGRAHLIAGVLGIIAMVLVGIPLFAGRFLSDPRLTPNGSMAIDVSGGAWLIGMIPLTFLSWSAVLFWRARADHGQIFLALCAVLLVFGLIIDGFLGAAFPALSPANAVAMAVLGYGVAKHQVFNPLRELTHDLETRVRDRTRELEKAYTAVEEQVQARTQELREEIRERAVTEQELRESETKFRVLSDQSPSMIFINAGGRVVYANQICADTMGYTREELSAPGFDFRTLIAPDSLELIGRSFARHSKGEEVEPYEYGLLTRGGRRLDAIITTTLIDYEGERAILGIITDISARKRTEDLLQSMNRAALALEKTFDPGSIFPIACSEMSGIGHTCMILLTDRDRQRFVAHRVQAGHGGSDRGETPGSGALEIPMGQVRILDESLQSREASLVSSRTVLSQLGGFPGADGLRGISDTGQCVLAPLAAEDEAIGLLSVYGETLTQEDVPAIQVFANQLAAAFRRARLMQELEESLDRLRQTQAQLVEAQRMEAVGRFAGGVAHDFNNILTAINGYAELLSFTAQDDDAAQQDITQIKHAVSQAAALTRQLLAFSRRQRLQPEVFDLNPVVEGMENMLSRLISEDVILDQELAAGPAVVFADRTQVEQVLMNLAVNARDAMPDGGRILLQTARVFLFEQEAKELELSPGPYVVLNFGDTGVGMSQDVQERVFEPFFTTKETGKGTGLGMSTAYGTIKQSGGAITVASEQGKGTTFSIYLPQGDAADDVSDQDVQAVADLGGTETILLVEDDDVVRDLTGRLLRTYGYTVVDASEADSAVAVCKDDTTTIDLILTDIVMPGAMNGVQLAQWAQQHLPEARVVLMSGHAVEAIRKAGLDHLRVPFVEKPFSSESLLNLLRATLDDN